MPKKKDIYKVGGTRVPGATTLTGILHKPALVPWAAKMVVTHIQENAPSIAEDGLEGWVVSTVMLDDAKNAHRKRLTDAGDIGSNIHSLIGAYIEGQLSPDGVNDDNERKALENFIKVTEGWEWLGSEMVVLHDPSEYKDGHPKRQCKPFGGTADALARLPDGRIVVVDFKTSSGVYPEHSLQVALYAYAQPEEPLRKYWEQITEGRILHFNKERLTWESLERDVTSHYPYIPAFRSVYEWTKTFTS